MEEEATAVAAAPAPAATASDCPRFNSSVIRRSGRILIPPPRADTKTDNISITASNPVLSLQQQHQPSTRKRHSASSAESSTQQGRGGGGAGRPNKKAKKATTTPTRKNPKRIKKQSAPPYLQDSKGNVVWLATATLTDINRAQRTKKHPFAAGSKKKQLYLHTVTSPQQRQAVYDRASRALQDIETCLLPTYGGRPWKVQVTVQDPVHVVTNNNTKIKKKTLQSPYFVFNKKGVLELAAWPHILLKIPSPPKFPGYYSSAQLESKQKTKERQRQKTHRMLLQQTDAAVTGEAEERVLNLNGTDDEEVDDDDDLLLNNSAQRLASDDDDKEWEYILDLQERDVTPLADLAYHERSRVPLPVVSYKWISPLREFFYTRKSAWEHAVQLCQQEVLLERTLRGLDTGTTAAPRALPSTTAPVSQKKAMEVGAIRFKRDGLWVVGQEESWKEERRLEEEEEEQQVEENLVSVEGKPRPLSAMQYYIQCNRLLLQSKRLKELEKEYKQQQGEAALAGNPKKLSFDDGDNNNKMNRKPMADAPNSSSSSKSKKFTLRAADRELRQMWKRLTTYEQEEWKKMSCLQLSKTETAMSVTPGGKTIFRPAPQQRDTKPTSAVPGVVAASVFPMEQGACVSKVLDKESSPLTSLYQKQREQQQQALESALPPPPTRVHRPLGCVSPSSGEEESSNKSGISPSQFRERGHYLPQQKERQILPEQLEREKQLIIPQRKQASATRGTDQIVAVSRSAVKKKAAPITSRKKPAPRATLSTIKPAPWTKWCLNADQIKLCYDAGMEHYDTVIATVKARDLHSELQDGFDVLRERCRGRFDMELPAFDTPDFKFLNCEKSAPWMPVVHQILGKDAVLIHKGMFLSMSGAEAQPYHQDGLHLTTQTQRECHAVNVFVPLVDLTLKHGPTEFCLGTHILDQDEYRAEFCEIPIVKAGIPIIFDYRLGHKGLSNSSGSCRPIVYCTYARAAGGREFRDKVNFSRSRYRKIGDLISQKDVPSRDERAKNRQRVIAESYWERDVFSSATAKE